MPWEDTSPRVTLYQLPRDSHRMGILDPVGSLGSRARTQLNYISVAVL